MFGGQEHICVNKEITKYISRKQIHWGILSRVQCHLQVKVLKLKVTGKTYVSLQPGSLRRQTLAPSSCRKLLLDKVLCYTALWCDPTQLSHVLCLCEESYCCFLS